MINRFLTLSFLAFTSISFGQIIVHQEDFQSGTLGSYTIVDNDGLTPNPAVIEFAPAWIVLEDPDMANDTIVGSTSYFEPVGIADRWLISPPITLSTYGNYLYWDAKSHDASFPDSYQVLISTTDNQLASFEDTILSVIQEFDIWSTYEIDLSDLGFDNQTIHVAIVNKTDDGFKLYIDDIKVEVEDPRGLAGISEVSASQSLLYPNPASNYIDVKGDQIDEILIKDFNGKLMLVEKSNHVDISSLSAGVYFVEITCNGQVTFERLIKN